MSAALSAADRSVFTLLTETHRLLVIDVETTDSDDGDRVVQVGVVTVRRGRLADRYRRLVNPGAPISAATTGVHGLTDADVADAPAFADVADELDTLLTAPDAVLVAHHARSDVGVLHREYARLYRVLPMVPVLDTMRLFRHLGHDTGAGGSLAALTASFGIRNRRPHDALEDAVATAKVLVKLLELAAVSGYSELDALLADAGTTTTAIPEGPVVRQRRRGDTAAVPVEHLATHVELLPDTATGAELDTWAVQATACARLRCPLLRDKAELATGHAAALLPRLLAVLPTLTEPGQPATLVSAVNVLVPRALDPKTAPAWWSANRAAVTAGPACAGDDTCPDCLEGGACPLVVAHHPVAAVATYLAPGPTPAHLRGRFIGTSTERGYIRSWVRQGMTDLAGHAAWLLADMFLTEANPARAATIVERAIDAGLTDPRLVRAHAQRLADQGRYAEATLAAEAALASPQATRRPRDPGYDDLAAWLARQRDSARSLTRAPNPRPGTHPRSARPAGRVRPNRFKLM